LTTYGPGVDVGLAVGTGDSVSVGRAIRVDVGVAGDDELEHAMVTSARMVATIGTSGRMPFLVFPCSPMVEQTVANAPDLLA
jgi:hypothetical protein